jgi:hypothetical protein
MPTTAELLRTFEELAVSQRRQADNIEALAVAQGMPLGGLSATVASLRAQAETCDSCAQALRDGDAFSIDEVMSGGIEGPFIDNEGREL